MLAVDAVRLLVALGWVAAGFRDEVGVTLEWAEVRLLRRLGGGEDRPDRATRQARADARAAPLARSSRYRDHPRRRGAPA